MKNSCFIIATCFLAIASLFTACQESAQNAKNITELSKNLQDLGQQLEKSMEGFSEKNDARRAKGDTTAMHYDKLKDYLPNPRGYALTEEPEGQIAGAQGLSYSQITGKYKSGGEELKVTIVDYNGALPLYTLATAVLKTNFFVENSREVTKGIDIGIEGVAGMKTLKKKEKKSMVVLGVGDRFMLTVEAKGQTDPDFAESVARSMKLKELVSM